MSTWKGWKNASRRSLGVKRDVPDRQEQAESSQNAIATGTTSHALTEEEKYVENLHSTDQVSFKSSTAKTIYTLAMQLNKTHSSNQLERNDNKTKQKASMFLPGKMAYVFSSVGIPDRVIRSQFTSSDQKGAGSAQDKFVLEQVISLLEKSKEEKKEAAMKSASQKAKELQAEAESKPVSSHHTNTVVEIDMNDDDDIFADVGTEYKLAPKKQNDLDTLNTSAISSSIKLPAEFTTDVTHSQNDPHEEEDGEIKQDAEDGLLAAGLQVGENELASVLKRLKRGNGSAAQERIAEHGLADDDKETQSDTDENGPPVRIERLQGLAPIGYQEDDAIFDFGGPGSDDEEADLTQLDLGVAQNKKRQLTRFDFDTHEEWIAYKENQVHMPKAAFQFGMKGESASKLKKAKLSHSKGDQDYETKFNREFQQLDKIYRDKYGTNLAEGSSSNHGKKRPSTDERQSQRNGGTHDSKKRK